MVIPGCLKHIRISINEANKQTNKLNNTQMYPNNYIIHAYNMTIMGIFMVETVHTTQTSTCTVIQYVVSMPLMKICTAVNIVLNIVIIIIHVHICKDLFEK